MWEILQINHQAPAQLIDNHKLADSIQNINITFVLLSSIAVQCNKEISFGATFVFDRQIDVHI